MEQQSEIWYDYFKARDNSIISDLFEGQLCSTITCKSCNYKSYTFDTFMDLQVSIPRKAIRYTGYVDVNECINSYV
jgi:ubiquitin C-terminal hydrolase